MPSEKMLDCGIDSGQWVNCGYQNPCVCVCLCNIAKIAVEQRQEMYYLENVRLGMARNGAGCHLGYFIMCIIAKSFELVGIHSRLWHVMLVRRLPMNSLSYLVVITSISPVILPGSHFN